MLLAVFSSGAHADIWIHLSKDLGGRTVRAGKLRTCQVHARHWPCLFPCPLFPVPCPLSSVLCPLSSVLCPLSSSVLCPLSAVLCPLSSVLCPLSSVLCPLSSVQRAASYVLPFLVAPCPLLHCLPCPTTFPTGAKRRRPVSSPVAVIVRQRCVGTCAYGQSPYSTKILDFRGLD